MGKNVRRLAVGTILAAAAGYVAGILTAPKSGKETRNDIKNATEKAISDAEKRLKILHTELNGLLSDVQKRREELKGKAQEELDKATDLARLAKEKARDMLSIAHEGAAGEKEIKQTVEEANKAADNLKKKLKS